jgi:hypothetical protein
MPFDSTGFVPDEAPVVKVLIAARAKIAHREHWTKGCEARDWRGRRVNAASVTGTRWCAVGAVRAVSPDCRTAVRAVEALERSLDGWGTVMVFFNDHPFRRHRTVLRVFDRAIEAERLAATKKERCDDHQCDDHQGF